MSDKLFALVTVITSGIFGLLVAVVTNYLTRSREEAVRQSDLHREKVRSIRELYEEACFILEQSITTRSTGTTEDMVRVGRFLSRLHLHVEPSIRDQYSKTSELVDAWTNEARQGEPERHPGYVVVSSTQPPHLEKAQAMWPEMQHELATLRKLMREHLAEVSRQTSQ